MRITKISQLPWKPDGVILDPFAGNKRWWKGLNNKVVFVDKYTTNVDVVADAASLPFNNETFDQIWADPPHLIRKSPFKPSSRFYRCSNLTEPQPLGYFGVYPSRDVLRLEWSAIAKELARVCKPNGFMVWKSIDGAKTIAQCCNYGDLDCLRPYWTLVDELRTPSCMSWSSATTIYTKWSKIQ